MNEVQITIPLQHLANAIVAQLTPLFAGLQKQQDIPPDDDYLTRKQTAALLNVSLPTLTNYTKSGIISGYRFGVRVLYKKADITNALHKIKGGNHA